MVTIISKQWMVECFSKRVSKCIVGNVNKKTTTVVHSCLFSHLSGHVVTRKDATKALKSYNDFQHVLV